jgi:hypothetical protein
MISRLKTLTVPYVPIKYFISLNNSFFYYMREKINNMVYLDRMDESQQQRYHSTTSNSSSNEPGPFERTNTMPADEKEILIAFEEVLVSRNFLN